MPDIRSYVEEPLVHPRGPSSQIAAAAERLPDFDDPAFGRLFDRFGDARIVMLGESSHGTSEFYQARAAITRWLVEKRGFNIVALEADWPDAKVLDARVRGRPAVSGKAFARFPGWLWKNREFDALLGWLAEHNRKRSRSDQVGIHGLDLYNLSASMRAVVDHLDRVEPEAAKVARERYGCLNPWAQEPVTYGRMAVSGRYAGCEGAVTPMLTDMLARQVREAPRLDGGDPSLDAVRGMRLLREADAYYRAMYYGGGEAWNLRAAHLFETLQALLEAKGRYGKAVVWAHNSHVGDARATEMGLVRDERNLGQLCRQAWGEQARLIGFGTHGGTVACASDWDGPMEVKAVRPSLAESQERQSHNAGIDRYLLDLRSGQRNGVRRALSDPRLERFIGVTYRPDTERWSHYAECRLAEQFDAWVWFDETTPVAPLTGDDGTWPFS
ncbi:MAG: erythromycin esterase family protein [Alphaproteobacteria bacterium]|nr:erythromycin esterase family protein [Alphaproteobacteria bacterium]MBU1514116.1 erythromycin esterase family protein [Alphaproteobacteria bacterium]MBU2096235.1 erythromycin esterase family protein [Alphaproteobacteria bacterium]MBU2151189.1 erythromycin esterase family protein [Alphaproteobacteria bacterium]MBU2307152.1 erythromycin esterase family protein [Alphaproteobacteria bacterium]